MWGNVMRAFSKLWRLQESLLCMFEASHSTRQYRNFAQQLHSTSKRTDSSFHSGAHCFFGLLAHNVLFWFRISAFISVVSSQSKANPLNAACSAPNLQTDKVSNKLVHLWRDQLLNISPQDLLKNKPELKEEWILARNTTAVLFANTFSP